MPDDLPSPEEEFQKLQKDAADARRRAHLWNSKYQEVDWQSVRVAEQLEERIVSHPNYGAWKDVNQDEAARLEKRVELAREERLRQAEKEQQGKSKSTERGIEPDK